MDVLTKGGGRRWRRLATHGHKDVVGDKRGGLRHAPSRPSPWLRGHVMTFVLAGRALPFGANHRCHRCRRRRRRSTPKTPNTTSNKKGLRPSRCESASSQVGRRRRDISGGS